MDDVLKRLVVAYLGFTAALWVISLAMIESGSAHPRNYAWVIVSNLRFYFTAPLVLALAVAVAACLFWFVKDAKELQQKADEGLTLAAQERKEREERNRRSEEEARAKAMHETARLAREKVEQAAAKRRVEEKQRQKAIERQTRSASAAAEHALDDF